MIIYMVIWDIKGDGKTRKGNAHDITPADNPKNIFYFLKGSCGRRRDGMLKPGHRVGMGIFSKMALTQASLAFCNMGLGWAYNPGVPGISTPMIRS